MIPSPSPSPSLSPPQVDVDLAREVAGTSLRNKDLQRKLWLKIAQHVIKKEKDIGRAIQFLQECSLLKIEDILPFFPDFVTIDHFKVGGISHG